LFTYPTPIFSDTGGVGKVGIFICTPGGLFGGILDNFDECHQFFLNSV